MQPHRSNVQRARWCCRRWDSDTQTRCGSVTAMVLVPSASRPRVSGCIRAPRYLLLWCTLWAVPRVKYLWLSSTVPTSHFSSYCYPIPHTSTSSSLQPFQHLHTRAPDSGVGSSNISHTFNTVLTCASAFRLDVPASVSLGARPTSLSVRPHVRPQRPSPVTTRAASPARARARACRRRWPRRHSGRRRRPTSPRGT